tara:strand:+ start:176 stop:775 length:600 start_codon:yes stop_codon:yes gene_type:complete
MKHLPIYLLLAAVLSHSHFTFAQNSGLDRNFCPIEIQIAPEIGFKDFSSYSKLFNSTFEHGYSFESEIMFGSSLAGLFKFGSFVANVSLSTYSFSKSEGKLESDFRDASAQLMLSYEFPFENWMICPLAGMGKCFSQSTFKSTEFGLNSTTSNLPNAIMVDWNYWQTHFGIYIGSSYTFSEILPNRKINFGLKYLNTPE